MDAVQVRRGTRWAFVVAVAVVGVVLAVIGAGHSNITADVLLICAVTLILIAGVVVMVETMICLTKQVTDEFDEKLVQVSERLGRNLCEMEATRVELRKTRDELVALQPKTEELAEEVASYAVFHCLTDPRGADGALLATTGTEDTGTHNVTRFRPR